MTSTTLNAGPGTHLADLHGAAPLERLATRPLRTVAGTVIRFVAVAGWLVVITGALLLVVPALMGLDRYVITGNSMVPMFDRGSVVFSEAVPVDDLTVGDVITYRPPAATHVTQLVTHRIASIETGENGRPVFVTKGDANAEADPWVFQLGSDTQNVVRHHVPLIGHVLAFLSNPSNRIVIIGVPAGLIAMRALLDLVRLALGRAEHDDVDGFAPTTEAELDAPSATYPTDARIIDLTEAPIADRALDSPLPVSRDHEGVLVR